MDLTELDYLAFEKILSYLSARDLISCTVVCKTWNAEVRQYMRKTGRFYIRFDLDENNCGDLEQLTQILCFSTFPLAVSGLGISSSPIQSFGRDPRLFADAGNCCWRNFTDALLARLENYFTMLSLNLHSWDQAVGPTILRIFAQVQSKLEVLIVKGDLPNDQLWSDLESSVHSLGNLREFKFEPSDEAFRLEEFCLAVASCAPSLKKLDGFASPYWLSSGIFKTPAELGTSQLIEAFEIINLNLEVHLADMERFEKTQPALRKLKVSSAAPLLDPEADAKFWAFNVSMIQSSSSTLVELHLSVENFGRLEGTSSILPKLRRLRINSASSVRLERAFRNNRFSVMFPALERVDIRRAPGFLTDENQEGPRPVVDLVGISPCATVRTVVIFDEPGDHSEGPSLLALLETTFPNVTHFLLDNSSVLDNYLQALWTVWPGLESITATKVPLRRLKNLDGVICGISEAEAKVRSTRSYLDLLALGPVAHKPCILSKTHLKVFRLEIPHNRMCMNQNGFYLQSPGTYTFSHVSGACGFAWMASMTLELYLPCLHHVQSPHCFSADHLKEFVMVKYFHSSFPLESVGLD